MGFGDVGLQASALKPPEVLKLPHLLHTFLGLESKLKQPEFSCAVLLVVALVFCETEPFPPTTCCQLPEKQNASCLPFLSWCLHHSIERTPTSDALSKIYLLLLVGAIRLPDFSCSLKDWRV